MPAEKQNNYAIKCLSAIEGLQGGRLSLSKKLGVTIQTINGWHQRQKIPGHAVLDLVKLSQGKFVERELLGGFDANPPKASDHQTQPINQ